MRKQNKKKRFCITSPHLHLALPRRLYTHTESIWFSFSPLKKRRDKRHERGPVSGRKEKLLILPLNRKKGPLKERERK